MGFLACSLVPDVCLKLERALVTVIPYAGCDATIQQVFNKDNAGSASQGSEADENARKKAKAAAPLQKVVQKIGVSYAEESLSARRDITRGWATLDQDETVYFVSHAALECEKRPRLKFPGTTAGNRITPVPLPGYDEVWNLSFKQKKELFGSNRVAVGGKTKNDPQKALVRPEEGLEPCFFHEQGDDLMAELLHTLGGSSHIKMLGGDSSIRFKFLLAAGPFPNATQGKRDDVFAFIFMLGWSSI